MCDTMAHFKGSHISCHVWFCLGSLGIVHSAEVNIDLRQAQYSAFMYMNERKWDVGILAYSSLIRFTCVWILVLCG